MYLLLMLLLLLFVPERLLVMRTGPPPIPSHDDGLLLASKELRAVSPGEVVQLHCGGGGDI